MTSTTEHITAKTLSEFRNEPPTDFSKDENRRAQEAALAQVKAELGRTYPIIIGGQRIETVETFKSVNPANPEQVVGVFAKATVDLANQAVGTAAQALELWKKVPAAERAAYLFQAAKLVRERKFLFNAWLIYEVGKSWVEADADTAEAIDFMEFYGREMLRLAQKQPLTRIPGEENDLVYIPLGVGAIIPPWNFALAIMTGLTTSAIVAGNTVVLKPAITSPTLAAKLVEVMEEVGLPAGVLNFLPGPGAQVGEAVVQHPLTRFISFTGSRDVGLHIHQVAAQPRPGQKWIKRTVLEMGGKDAVVVDETVDLDAAATGIVASAFGFQGQKCSAGSRAIVVEQVYDELVQKVVEKAKTLTIGDPTDPNVAIGPVIDDKAYRKINEYIEIGKGEGKLLLGGKTLDRPGYFIEPTIFADVAPNARIAQEEIFGPVLAIIKAKDFDDALALANNTEYGLTGALYSQDRRRIERAKEEFYVGNLYINRKCTGALVGVHPFGGFNMSGTDSKAGGRDYLLLFTQAKVASEKQVGIVSAQSMEDRGGE
jgi:1-pyrroline-5-carboxylate dehydrogenase